VSTHKLRRDLAERGFTANGNRIRRLEERFGLRPVETEFSRRLCERIEERSGGWPCHTLQQARSEKAPGERVYGGPDSIIGGRRTRPAARDLGVATLQGSGSGKPLDVPQDVTTSCSAACMSLHAA